MCQQTGCGTIATSIALINCALGMFILTYVLTIPNPSLPAFRLALSSTKYGCIWAGIPAIISAIVGIVAKCNKNIHALVAFIICCIITCLCLTAMAIVLYLSCKGICFEVWSLSWHFYILIALMFGNVGAAIQILVGSIVAYNTLSKWRRERDNLTGYRETIPMEQSQNTAVNPNIQPGSTQYNQGFA